MKTGRQTERKRKDNLIDFSLLENLKLLNKDKISPILNPKYNGFPNVFLNRLYLPKKAGYLRYPKLKLQEKF